VMLIYRQDFYRISKNGILFITKKDEQANRDYQIILYFVIGTITVGGIGLIFGDVIGERLTNTKIVGQKLIIKADAFCIIRNLRGRKKDGDLTSKDAVIVGLAQAVAVTPGISRSGASIVASMLVGMKQETALRFSFLLYIPVSLGTTMLEVPEIVQDPNFD